ncbi:LuxR C-terminal-related transcriptional regulator [Streptomyces sp. NBC_01420]|uniref:helix-turn-helix transcriptional regulator n=1 Tax=Streptomyces sp. NBC_01420 TaxID=2903858 RepID=UPI0032510357
MSDIDWSSPASVMSAIADVQRAPLGDVLHRLSALVEPLVPHTAAAQLTGFCGHSPLKTTGTDEAIEALTSTDLGRLASQIPVGAPWRGKALLGGAERAITAVAATASDGDGSLLVLIDTPAGPLPSASGELLQSIWDLVTAHLLHRALDPEPEQLARSRAASGERQRVTAELTSSYAVTLTALLATLRARSLGDAAARQAATDLAASALIDLRRTAQEDPADSNARRVFEDLTDELSPIRRYSDVRLSLRPPETARPVPSETAYAARSVTLTAVLDAFTQDTVQRVHAGWHLTDHALTVTVRDDSPGARSDTSITARRLHQIAAAAGGEVALDTEPEWGTTITATFSLNPAETAAQSPLDGLAPRELDVLTGLTQGLSNRTIAEELHIGETTVKFHVRNILKKLTVSSRGQAAALARDAGLGLTPSRHP